MSEQPHCLAWNAPGSKPLPHLICSRPMFIGGVRRISMAVRDELVAAISGGYARAVRTERGCILDEFTAVTGFHRKHAMRLLRAEQLPAGVLARGPGAGSTTTLHGKR
jgi:hypothetical protein